MKELNCLMTTFIQATNQPKSVIPDSSSSTPLQSLLREVTCLREDIFTILSILDSSKTLGIGNIGPRSLKSCAISLYESITLLLQKSIRLNQIPWECDVHLITPILKSGVPSNITNYQLIALLCAFSKVLEKVLFNVIYFPVYPSSLLTNLA